MTDEGFSRVLCAHNNMGECGECDAPATFELNEEQANALDAWIDDRGGILREPLQFSIKPHMVVAGCVALGILTPVIPGARDEAFYRGRDSGRKFQQTKNERLIEELTDRARYWKARAKASEGRS